MRGSSMKLCLARQAMASLSDQVNRVRNKSDFDSATAFLQKKEECSSEECQTQGIDACSVSRWRSSRNSSGSTMCVSLTGLGDRVVRMNGLPIGGLLSKSVCKRRTLSRGARVDWKTSEKLARLG